LDVADVRTRGCPKVRLVGDGTRSAVDVQRRFAHPAAHEHDDGVWDSRGVERRGEAGAVGVPGVDLCCCFSAGVEESSFEERVENRVRERRAVLVREKRRRFSLAVRARLAQLDVSNGVTRVTL